MYISKRAIIDTRKYDVREMFFRYKQGKVWFYEKNATAWKKPKKIVREVLWALTSYFLVSIIALLLIYI